MLTLLLATAALSGHAPVWMGCERTPATRPARVIVACADANFYVDHLRWTSWKASSATATGTAHANDCTPYCAAGHFHAFEVRVRLSKPVACAKGRRVFARIAWTAAARKPPYPNGSETLGCT